MQASRRKLLSGSIALLLSALALADDPVFFPPLNLPKPFQLPSALPGPRCLGPESEGPCTVENYEEWLQAMRQQRVEHRIRIGYNSSRYESPALKWAQSSFIQPQMMAHERYFYDPVKHRYTVERYLQDLKDRYGGIDAVLIWPVYPNIGVDDRNQHDLIRSMPGGVEGVKQMVAEFHRRNVRVLFPMMMWDQGTRDPGQPWPEAVAELMKEVGADGVNGDTQLGVPVNFVEAAERVNHPLIFQPEVAIFMADEAVAYNLMSWGTMGLETTDPYPFTPTVNRHKWIEPQHMVNISNRWGKDKSGDLQFAFFNGIGWESWENIWGIWNGISPRDGEALRRMATIERGVAPFLVSQEWQPFYPMSRHGVFASRWPRGEQTVWTIVNRNDYEVQGAQMEVAAEPGVRYFDLYHGVELPPAKRGDKEVLQFEIEPKGYGAIYATKGAPDGSISKLITEMSVMTQQSLAKFSKQRQPLLQKMTPIAATVSGTSPQGMIKIPAGEFSFQVRGVEIEGQDDNEPGVDVQYSWEAAPRRFHEHLMQVKSFWMDLHPVTNSEFKRFLDATHYHPEDDLNFLRDWKNGMYPEGWARKPVTWVSREDADAFARWAGKRLPHEWEWQYAAQGTDGRIYPWGNEWDAKAVPTPDKGRNMRGPDDVNSHPSGASPFGVMDMVGNVWQWTDEFTDDHTRAGILRGGSYYQPQGSRWYFPQAYKLTEHGKLLLMAPSMDRSGGIGFRCVKD
jgi:formylglycine-generating enzyme required for sulfatase activity